MNVLKNKIILIISTDKWRNLFVSKHQYAIELSKRNNEIIFLNPVEPGTPFFRKTKIERYSNIYAVDFNRTIRGERFYSKLCINVIEYIQIKLFLILLRKKIDIVWCFSDFSFKSINYFNARNIIFHPVDMMMSGGNEQANHADLILSVAKNIIEPYRWLRKKNVIINHGLSASYKALATHNLDHIEYKPGNLIKVGYVGSLLRPDIDHDIFLKIISQFPEVEFNIWGPYDYKSINLEYDLREHVVGFIDELKSFDNVNIHGLVDSEKLANLTCEMDVFFICYDAKKEINKCSNNHKIIEYFSTGKCVVSHFISTYKNKRDLVVMPFSHNNDDIPELMGKVFDNLEIFNSGENMKKRINYALNNTYEIHVDRIDKLLGSLQ